MAFVHEESCECTKLKLDLFSVPPTQTSMEQGSLMEYHPFTTVADGSSIEFDDGASGEDDIDFANTMLYVKAKITRADGTNLAVDSPTGPSNLFLHSLFSQVDVSLNGTLITASTNTCPYRAMMETLLSYGEDAKRTQLTSGLFYKERAGRMDSVDLADNAANDGLVKRRALGLESRTFDMMDRLHADIFFQDRYMINEVGVKIKLTRSKDDFCLMEAMVGKVQIVQASMFVRKVKLMPSVFLAHAKTLERSPAKYPIRRVVCKSFTILQNYLDVSHEKLFSGRTRTLYKSLQQHVCRNEGLYISREDYSAGYALYAFDLTADLGEEDHFSLVRQGSVRLSLKFSAALANTVAYAEFENVIEVDGDRNVVFDFGV